MLIKTSEFLPCQAGFGIGKVMLLSSDTHSFRSRGGNRTILTLISLPVLLPPSAGWE